MYACFTCHQSTRDPHCKYTLFVLIADRQRAAGSADGVLANRIPVASGHAV
jgi:hypothetical protein